MALVPHSYEQVATPKLSLPMEHKLTNLWDLTHCELIRSNADKKHPFRKVVLGTLHDYPETRWVIKRHIEADTLRTLIYTDTRSPKAQQIRANGNISLLYYHPKKQLQVRMSATATLLTSGRLYEEHKANALQYPKDYSTELPPGTIQSGEYLYGDTIHFAVVVCVPSVVDILQLGKPSHSRAMYSLVDGSWIGKEVVP